MRQSRGHLRKVSLHEHEQMYRRIVLVLLRLDQMFLFNLQHSIESPCYLIFYTSTLRQFFSSTDAAQQVHLFLCLPIFLTICLCQN